MASPQKENGFTQISNELLEAIIKLRCSNLQKDLILATIRYTYGFNRKEHSLSIRFLARLVNRLPHKISEALNELIKRNIIQVLQEYKSDHTSRILRLNKDYDTWINNSSEIGNSSQKGNSLVPKSVTKKYNKDKSKKCRRFINAFSIENIPIGLNGELFLKTKFFYITQELKKELIEKLSLGLGDSQLKAQFYKMEEWIEQNEPKKNYKAFFMNWLDKPEYQIKEDNNKTLVLK